MTDEINAPGINTASRLDRQPASGGESHLFQVRAASRDAWLLQAVTTTFPGQQSSRRTSPSVASQAAESASMTKNEEQAVEQAIKQADRALRYALRERPFEYVVAHRASSVRVHPGCGHRRRPLADPHSSRSLRRHRIS